MQLNQQINKQVYQQLKMRRSNYDIISKINQASNKAAVMHIAC